ncbi:MAG: uridine kinase [Flavobacteriales bacterium]|mgnify:CR=1 FL=1|nr:uridine kinase [Flavobacteriales bacterium]HRN40631.1 uridine kinase [Vicingus sp.]MBV6484897.1 Uridine kinase [Flavobacteriales bacterium]MBX2958465.1 uridine kinase [Flavobacteriales bacterium]MCL4856960.1 uridine kinase [Flavobacteriales bacterium]
MIIIGIAGGTGSGKTTVVQRIANVVPEENVAILMQDSYYNDNTHLSFEDRTKINYDHPNSIDFDLLLEHITKLKERTPIEQPIYSYTTHSRTGDYTVIHPKEILIVEGILIFTSEQLRKMCDIKIFVHTDSDLRLIRRIKRDINERGRDLEEVLNRYENTLKPMHNQFIEPTMKYADLIIPVGGENKVAIDILTSMIKEKIKK